MITLGIFLCLIGMYYLYIQLFQTRENVNIIKSEKRNFNPETFLSVIRIILTLGVGILILIVCLIFNYSKSYDTSQFINFILSLLKTILPLIFIVGFIYTFFPGKVLSGLKKTIRKIPKNEKQYLTTLRIKGIIILLFALSFLIYLFFN